MIPAICIGGFDNDKLKCASDAGFKAVELNFGELALKKDTEISEYLDYIKSLGMYPVAGNCFIPWILKNENGFFQSTFDIEEVREYVDMAFEKTKCIKWDSIAFGSGAFRRMPDGYDKQKALDMFADIIVNIIIPKLEKYDAVLSIEELNSAETNFLNNCTETAELARNINHPKVGVLCDYFHMSLAGETYKDVPVFADKITHLHIASPSNKRAMPFANDGDGYSLFLDALKKCGYTGKYLSVEGAVPEGMNTENAFKECFSYLDKLTKEY